MNAELHEFAQTIAEALKSAPINKELWRAEDIASYLGCSKDQVARRYACRPDFPASIRLPYSKRDGEGYSVPMWEAGEVRQWVLKHKKKGRKRSA